MTEKFIAVYRQEEQEKTSGKEGI